MRLFNRIILLTPESVELEFTLAGIGSRALALLIDYSILLVFILGFWILWAIFVYQLLDFLENTGVNYADLPIWLVAIAILFSSIIYTGYFIFFEVRWQGQTPGKRFAKIRVICDDGKPIRLSQASLRSLLRPIDDTLFIGTFFILFGKREKRLGDWVAGTVVIQEERPQGRSTFVISGETQQLATELPQITNLSQLLPDDFAIISEYLHRRRLMQPRARADLSLKLARQTKAIIQLETVPPGLDSDRFLEAVYLAYQEQFPAY
ncbi:MAG: RDD family protein [Cyanobacteria bacterium CRU_2_1]|nr:RDD family protein [Cyanobacteria bacterium RU_5_0]NJR61484.1 RDD family protein [Cyanobacteria bacterium CRU_2_1]